MAKRLQAFPGEPRQYHRFDFPVWDKGGVWELSRADDFPNLTPRLMAIRAHNWATAHNKFVRTTTDRENETIVLQFTPKDETP